MIPHNKPTQYEKIDKLRLDCAIYYQYKLDVEDHTVDGKYIGKPEIRQYMYNKASILRDASDLEKMLIGFEQDET